MSTKPGSGNQMKRHSKKRGGIRFNERTTGRSKISYRKGKISSRSRLTAQNMFGTDVAVGNIRSRSITRQLKAQRKKSQG